MKITLTSIEMLAAEAKEIRLAIPGMLEGLSKNSNDVLSTDGIITKSDLDSINKNFQAVRTNLAPYADEVLSITRSIAKPRKDGSRLEVPAALLDDLKAFRADVLDTLEDISHMAESFRKRANMHNMSLGNFKNLLEPPSEILVPDVFAAAGIKSYDPQAAAEPTAEMTGDTPADAITAAAE